MTCPSLAALPIAYDSDLTANQIQAIIQFSAEDDDANDRRDHYYGYGRINAYQALLLAGKKRFALKGSDGLHKASFDRDGNLIVEGDLTENATSQELTPAASDLMVFRDSGAACVARVAEGGDLFFEGTMEENAGTLTAPAGSPFVWKDGTTTLAYVDGDGNLKVKGRVFLGYDPDRASSQGE